VVKDDVLPNGYKVPAGVRASGVLGFVRLLMLGFEQVNVAWSMYCMGRMEKYWDRPLEFLPERWLDPEKNKERHPFLFIPFQGTLTVVRPGREFSHLQLIRVLCCDHLFQLGHALAWGRTWPISKPR
jgi:hypothetical protein